jgi:hypothetical protein
VIAKHAKHGGPRRGSGRPLGAKDAVPRKGSVSPKDREEALQAELGKAYKERDDLKRQVDDLRFQLNYRKAFAGDSKALLTSTYKGEYVPTQEQLYAAKTLLDREYPTPEPGQYETDNTGKVVLYLPHNGRDPLPGETEAEKEKREKEFDDWFTMVVRQSARMVARRLLGKPKPRYEGGDLACVVETVNKVMDELEAQAAEAEAAENARKGGHRADTTPPPDTQPVVKPVYNGAAQTFGPAPAPAQIVAVIHSIIDAPGLLI